MRFILVPLVLLAALPAHSQGAERHWYFDVHRYAPSFEGHYVDTSGNNPVDVDLGRDLGLKKDSTKIGFGLEYQGPRFGVELSRDEQDYKGLNRVARTININGTDFNANTLVSSSLKATTNTFNWTIRAFKRPQYWIGIDLGARATQLEIAANGTELVTQANLSASYKATLPVPQLGLAAGFVALDSRLVGRAYLHYLGFKGASYTHPGADLRFFPISWLGVRVFTDAEHFKVPKGSVKDTLDIALDRSGTGAGIVARW